MKKILLFLFLTFFGTISLFSQPDYKSISPFFKKYIDKEGYIDYKTLKKNEQELSSTLKIFTDIIPQENWYRNEKLAYWLNVYNLKMISLIVENYPINRITDLNEGKVWQVKSLIIGNKSYSLDDIEHDIIRGELKEPRIHFALFSGAVSGPFLLNDVFTPGNMNGNYEILTKRYIDSKNNQITPNKIILSMIFDWYKDDFKDNISFINRHSKVKIQADAVVTFQEYDWQLRERKNEKMYFQVPN